MDVAQAASTNPHLTVYLAEFMQKHPAPTFVERVTRDMKSIKKVNIIYPVGDPIFIHIWDDEEDGDRHYVNIVPKMTPDVTGKYQKGKDSILRPAPS